MMTENCLPPEFQFQDLVFLKLGGSLITDKTQPHTPRLDVLTRLAGEIAKAWNEHPGMHLVLGHGSGSFGHIPGKQFGTRQGVRTPEQWRGFVEVWREAQALNRLVMDILTQAGLPAIAFSPFASVIARDAQVERWDLTGIISVLQAGLLPVIFGDAIIDTERGGTILSTEDLFAFLAPRLCPKRLLLAGIEPGVWADFPKCSRLLDHITPASMADFKSSLAGSSAPDVTGGMASKVNHSLELVERVPGLQVHIFSAAQPQALSRALRAEQQGTLIHAD